MEEEAQSSVTKFSPDTVKGIAKAMQMVNDLVERSVTSTL